MEYAINNLFTFLDYSNLQSKIQGISNGGSLNFQYYFDDKSCGSICKSKQVRKGCKNGFKCNVRFKCQNSNCLCSLQMSCTNGKSHEGTNLLENHSEHSEKHFEHSEKHFEHSEKHSEHSEKHSEHSEKHDNGATLVGNSGNNVIFEGRNSGEGGSGNSATISAEFLGLLKTSNIY